MMKDEEREERRGGVKSMEKRRARRESFARPVLWARSRRHQQRAVHPRRLGPSASNKSSVTVSTQQASTARHRLMSWQPTLELCDESGGDQLINACAISAGACLPQVI